MQSNVTPKSLLGLFASIFLLHSVWAQNTSRHFKSDLDFGSGTVISTFLDLKFSNKGFKIHSPKNADVRIVGWTKARLGRLLGKLPKKGTIVTIKGQRQQDSLFGDTRIPMFGKLKFKGSLKNEILSGTFFNEKGESMGTLQGNSSTESKINYEELSAKLIQTLKENIYSTRELQTKEWKSFEKKTTKLSRAAQDDIELFFGFNMLAQKLPFTHVNFLIAQDTAGMMSAKSSERSVFFEEKNSSTAYLQIKNFSSSEKELDSILPKIVENSAYKNLIIDLRNNGGGGVGAAFALAKYIVTEDMDIGYFPTNKLNYNGFEPEVFKTLPELQPKSTLEFGNELRRSPGVKMVFKKPTNAVFKGQLYVLTNGGTASTCEPIVYALKSRKKAIIVGEKTYGGMLSASPFVVSGKYLLLLPIGDFYTNDGQRLDKVGVEPNVQVKSADALKKVMELIEGVQIKK